jgi:hypothetical protein
MKSIDNINLWAQNVINHWNEKNIELGKGASESEIREAEDFIGIKFPISFIELYKRANGFKDSAGRKYVSIWPIQKIVKNTNRYSNKNFVSFCDYFIFSHCLGFLKSSDGIFKDYGHKILIASSFEECIDLINANSNLIY